MIILRLIGTKQLTLVNWDNVINVEMYGSIGSVVIMVDGSRLHVCEDFDTIVERVAEL